MAQFLFLGVVSCGDSLFISKVKDYYFEIEPASAENYRIFGKLFQNFNTSINANVLHLVDRGDLDGAETSYIKLTSGLHARDNKLGWGKWIRHSELNSGRNFLRQPQRVRRDVYTMRLEYDRGYLKERYYSDKESHKRQLKTLFLHELGHGFQMKHDPDRAAVMYREVNDSKKDLSSYYLRVQEFLRK